MKLQVTAGLATGSRAGQSSSSSNNNSAPADSDNNNKRDNANNADNNSHRAEPAANGLFITRPTGSGARTTPGPTPRLEGALTAV